LGKEKKKEMRDEAVRGEEGWGGGGLRKETEVKVSETRSRRAGTEMAVFPHCPRIRPSSHLPRFLGQSHRILMLKRSPHNNNVALAETCGNKL
jgi:hypothetical protein